MNLLSVERELITRNILSDETHIDKFWLKSGYSYSTFVNQVYWVYAWSCWGEMLTGS
jgi:hypothetical protein